MLVLPGTAAPRFCARHVAGALVLVVTAFVIDPAAGPARVAAATGPCPPAIVLFAGGVPFAVYSPVYDSTFVPGLYDSAHVAFDRTQGRMSVSVSSEGRNITSLRVVERLDIAGVPVGTPVTGALQFSLDGWSDNHCGGSSCGVRFEGTLVVGADSVVADANQQGPGYRIVDVATTLSLPVHFVAGSPIEVEFFINYGTGPGGSADAEGTATYRVSDLPAGVHAIACGGSDVTPVRRASWGMLKSIYR